jgi:uncharacterized protein YecE (DUF72 family)
MTKKIHLGLPRWESALLRGTLYDHRCPIEEFLFHYASQFDCAELQETFDDLPYESDMRALREVVEKTNPGFRFCPWIPRRVSHEFPLGDNYHDMREFLAAVGELGPHLGPIVLKLPETLPPESWMKIVKFARRCPANKRFVVHLTHAEWFKKTEYLRELARELSQTPMNILLEDDLSLDVPFHELITGDHVMIRYKSVTKPELDQQRLATWVDRLGEYRRMGIQDSFFLLYEEEEMCLDLLRKLAGSMGGAVKVPEKYDENADQTSFEF